MTKKRPVDYDRTSFLAERAKYIRALRRAGYEWNEMLEHLNLVDSDQVRRIHEQLDILGRMQEAIAVGQTAPINLDDLERRITSDHNAKLSRTQMLALIAQIREFRTVMYEVGADLAKNFVGADAEERYGLQEHGKRLLRAAGDQAPAQPQSPRHDHHIARLP